MLEGLEVSEINYRDVGKIIDYRIEAEYFNKRFLNNDKLLLRNSISFFEIANYDNGRAYASDKFSELNSWENQSIKVAKIGDVTQKRFIEQWENLELEEFTFQKGELLKTDDILMSLTGDPPDIGKVSLIFEMPCNATWNQRVAKIYLRDNQNVFLSNKTFYVVLSTKYCREQLERYAKGIRQRNLGTECLQEMKIPVISNSFQRVIEETIQSCYLKIQNAKALYTEAENILLEELGLNNWQPTIKNNNTKTLKESFLSSGRIDAEYYQPKYDEIEEKIINYKGGFDQVKNICNLKTQNFQPQDDVIYNYIELANIGSNGVIKDVTLNEGKDLPSRARRIVKTNDVIVSSVEGSLASCAIIPKEFNNAICSTGFYVINSKNINSETLLLLFKTAVIHLMEKGCSGTILTAINNEEFFKIPLPTIDENIQKTISDKIQQSFALQSKSKQLLEAAKKAVEMAIEQNEEMAMDYLKVIETNIEYATTKSTPSYAHFSELQ